jgi:hypothetical protein
MLLCGDGGGARGSLEAKAVDYKPESRKFETRWGWNFEVT